MRQPPPSTTDERLVGNLPWGRGKSDLHAILHNRKSTC
jgi:hypothetical protein